MLHCRQSEIKCSSWNLENLPVFLQPPPPSLRTEVGWLEREGKYAFPAADNSSLASGKLITEHLLLQRKSPSREWRAQGVGCKTLMSIAAPST
jgi:hypothetical protein